MAGKAGTFSRYTGLSISGGTGGGEGYNSSDESNTVIPDPFFLARFRCTRDGCSSPVCLTHLSQGLVGPSRSQVPLTSVAGWYVLDPEGLHPRLPLGGGQRRGNPNIAHGH